MKNKYKKILTKYGLDNKVIISEDNIEFQSSLEAKIEVFNIFAEIINNILMEKYNTTLKDFIASQNKEL